MEDDDSMLIRVVVMIIPLLVIIPVMTSIMNEMNPNHVQTNQETAEPSTPVQETAPIAEAPITESYIPQGGGSIGILAALIGFVVLWIAGIVYYFKVYRKRK